MRPGQKPQPAFVCVIAAMATTLGVACVGKIVPPDPGSVGEGTAGAPALGAAPPGSGAPSSGATSPPADTCSGWASSLIYGLGPDDTLFGFDPATSTVTKLGHADCPASQGAPYAMAVDRQGSIYASFEFGGFYRIDVRTLACTATPLRHGLATNPNVRLPAVVANADGSETLFVTGYSSWHQALGVLDTTSFAYTPVAPFVPKMGIDQLGPAVAGMAGTGKGQLFAWTMGPEYMAIAEVDPTSARVLGRTEFPTLQVYNVEAAVLAPWGGRFYLFGAFCSASVCFLDLATRQVTQVPTADMGVSTAGVSTCAP